ncbi:MAG: AzlD domain-containing protein [Erysipelothrix sp.]|nr:AzlD domain-containing protein [Erysipelothrix sp.]
MSNSTFMILIILMLSTLLPRFAPFWFYKTFEKSLWWRPFAIIMPSLLLGVLVMISLSDSFFQSLQWIELSGLGFMIVIHFAFKKVMLTMLSGSLLVIILKTFL